MIVRQFAGAAACVFAGLCGGISSAYARNDDLQEGDRVMATLGSHLDARDEGEWSSMPRNVLNFIARCPAGQQVAGFDIEAGAVEPYTARRKNYPFDSYTAQPGDGVYGIRPICVTAFAPAGPGPFEPYRERLGGAGPQSVRLVCPGGSPVVTKLKTEIEVESELDEDDFGKEVGSLPSVNGIGLYCGLVGMAQGRHAEGPAYWGAHRTQQPWTDWGNNTCADDLVAVGITGQATYRVRSLGLICGNPVLTAKPTVKAQGRVKLAPSGKPSPWLQSICDKAEMARARNSPATPGLEAQCAAQPKLPPIEDHDGLVARGEAIANEDPLAMQLLDQQPDNSSRLGFDIGMAVAEKQTAYGPGKQRTHDALPADERAGFRAAVDFSLERNANAELAAIGATIAASDPPDAAARNVEEDVFFRLGFDIATGLFGDPALGAIGNTLTGPGSLKIREALSAAGQRGFDAAVAFHQSRSYPR